MTEVTTPWEYILLLAGAVGALLLIAPWVPPFAALGAMVFIALFGTVLFYGGQHVVSEVHDGWVQADPERESVDRHLTEAEKRVTELQERYQQDESYGEQEFEEDVEEVLEDHGVLYEEPEKP